MEKHCTERFQNFAPTDQHIDVFLNLFQETGGMDFHSIRTYVPERKGETVVILKDRNFSSWHAFVMRLDEKNDSLISGLNFAIARTPSTVKDLHRFARAIQTGKLVSQESLDKMWKDYAGGYYGYGFSVEEGLNGKVVGHGGGFDGINSNLDIFLDKGYIIAVMSNYDNSASPIAQKIGQLLARVR